MPQITGVLSLDGFVVEVTFSEPVTGVSASNPANYALAVVLGAPATIASVALGPVQPGPGGYLTVQITTSGTTLGGSYTVAATGVFAVSGPAVDPTPFGFLALGDQAQVVVTSPTGDTVLVAYRTSDGDPQPVLLPDPDFTNPATYAFSTDYLIAPIVGTPVQVSNYEVEIPFDRQTNATYELVVDPSLCYDYDGSVLPSADPNFSGYSNGTGASTASTSTGLVLTKSVGSTYGWTLEDTSGRLVAGANYRADVTINTTLATISPAVSNANLLAVTVSDGANLFTVSFADVAGTKVLAFYSGALSASVSYDWTAGPVALSIIHNVQAGFYTVLVGGVPVYTVDEALVTGVSGISAVQVLLDSPFAISGGGVRVGLVELNATSTLFTPAWNFISGVTTTFVGSPALATQILYTRYGPLVKDWGDTTPATKNDVEVRVNGTPVTVAEVNPYNGEIYPLVAIPLTPAGTTTVEIDYAWFATPAMPFAGLNVRGLTLNSWSQASGHTPGALSPTPPTSLGSTPTNRFPIGTVLPQYRRATPLRVGHKYYGFQRAYSALLNNYTSMRLNQNPNAISDGNLVSQSEPQVAYYEGNESPTVAVPPWRLTGSDTGSVLGNGFYQITSSPLTEAVYDQEVNLARQTSVDTAFRLLVRSYVADGIFTGVGFGLHDNRNLILVGFVIVDGVRSVGLLNDPSYPDLEASWTLGPSLSATAISQTVISVPYSGVLVGLVTGDKIRIPSGPQAGVYTIAECGLTQVGDVVEITLTTPLPADIRFFGNNTFQILLDIDFGVDTTYRIQASFPEGTASVFIGGRLSGLALTLTSPVAYPAQTALVLPTRESGVVFWGNVDRASTNVSDWNFVRYNSTPASRTTTVTGILDTADMTVTPDYAVPPWFITENFGYGEIAAPGTLLLKSTRGATTGSPDLEFGYARLEPFLAAKDVVTDFTSTFRVESAVLGAGDAQMRVRNGQREIRLSTLQYAELGTRFLYRLGQASISGLRQPDAEGWAAVTGNNLPTPVVAVQRLVTRKPALVTGPTAGFWLATVPVVTPTVLTGQGAIFEARVRVTGLTYGTSPYAGPAIGAYVPTLVPNTVRDVRLYLATGNTVVLTDATGVAVAGGTFAFTWDDGEFHDFRVTVDPLANAVSVVADDTVLGSVAFALFVSSAGTALRSFFGQVGDAVNTTEWDGISCTWLRATHLTAVFGRTLGVWIGNDDQDIDNYQIARTALSPANQPNSSLLVTPVSMNWTSYIQVRMRIDPNWGVSIYLPGFPPIGPVPPEFISETTDPTAAYINVETIRLPAYEIVQPEVPNLAFGALDPRSVTQQRWQPTAYRLRGTPNGSYIAPTGMVLNRATAFTSGEYTIDRTPEVADLVSRTALTINVRDSAIQAARVYFVEVDGTPLAASAWSFNETNQTITLVSPLPAEQYPVRVTFAVGQPVTATYLCGQPISETVTVLNEGTPIVPADQSQPETRTVVPTPPYGSVVEFTAGPNSRIVGLTECIDEEGDHLNISTLCDGPGPGLGLSALAMSGPLFNNAFTVAGGPGGFFGGPSPTVNGSAQHFNGTALMAAGGRPFPLSNGSPVFTSGVLNTNPLQPNARGVSGGPPPPGMGMNQDFRMVVRDVLADSGFSFGDNVPPSQPQSVNPNPNGTPGLTGNGACFAVLTTTTTSILGPLTGPAALLTLSNQSLLAGGAPLTGNQFTLVGGSPIAAPTTTFVIEAAN